MKQIVKMNNIEKVPSFIHNFSSETGSQEI